MNGLKWNTSNNFCSSKTIIPSFYRSQASTDRPLCFKSFIMASYHTVINIYIIMKFLIGQRPKAFISLCTLSHCVPKTEASLCTNCLSSLKWMCTFYIQFNNLQNLFIYDKITTKKYGILTLTEPRAWEIGYTQPCIKCQGKSATHFIYFRSRKTLPSTHLEATSYIPNLNHFPIYYRLLHK